MNNQLHTARTGPQRAAAACLLRIPYWLLVALLAALVLDQYLELAQLGGEARTSFASMVYGTAHRPFVYRALLPGLVRALTPLAPPGLARLALENPLVARWVGTLDGASQYPVEALLLLAGTYASLLLFPAGLRCLVRAVGPGLPGWLVDGLAVLGIPGVLAFTFCGHLYDLPTLALFTLALALLARGRWPAYLVAFVLTTLSKETSLLLLAVFLVHWRSRLPRRPYAALALAQAGLYGLVRLALIWAFRDNPGGLVEYHLPEHLTRLQTEPASLAFYTVTLGLPALLAALCWRQTPAYLRHASLACVPPLVVLFAVFGFPYEIRVFLETYPLLVGCVGCGLGGVRWRVPGVSTEPGRRPYRVNKMGLDT